MALGKKMATKTGAAAEGDGDDAFTASLAALSTGRARTTAKNATTMHPVNTKFMRIVPEASEGLKLTN